MAQALVIESELVEESGVEIADVNRVFGDVVAHFIGFTVDLPSLDSAPGEPEGEATGVVVAAVVGFGETALAVDGAAEFPAKDHEGVIEHASLLDVLNETVDALVDVFALAARNLLFAGCPCGPCC